MCNSRGSAAPFGALNVTATVASPAHTQNASIGHRESALTRSKINRDPFGNDAAAPTLSSKGGPVTTSGPVTRLAQSAAASDTTTATTIAGRRAMTIYLYLNKSNMYEYLTVSDRSVRSGRSNKS